MPFYNQINEKIPEGKRTLERLLQLRQGLDAEIPRRTFQETLLLATWNIRDFDKPTFDFRLDESIYYIAEIISRFDVVAVQEVYRDLEALHRVMKVLGSHWEYVVSDVTEGKQGNDERMAYLYDTRKVKFGGLAGELVLPAVKNAEGILEPVTQVWRTPMMVGFKSGWTDFILATVHIQWGSDAADSEERIREIRDVANFLSQRTKDPTAWSRNLILMGDFNIFDPNDATFQQLNLAGFEVPNQLLQFMSNAQKNRHYDQIALRPRPYSLDFTGQAGVFDYYQYVYKNNEEDKAVYLPYMTGYETKSDGKPRSAQSKKNYYQTYWRTHQMSDHLPMWVELRIDYSDRYLKRKLEREE